MGFFSSGEVGLGLLCYGVENGELSKDQDEKLMTKQKFYSNNNQNISQSVTFTSLKITIQPGLLF